MGRVGAAAEAAYNLQGLVLSSVTNFLLKHLYGELSRCLHSLERYLSTLQGRGRMVLAPGVAMNMYIHTSYEAILEHAKSMRASLHAPVDPRRLASELEPLPEH